MTDNPGDSVSADGPSRVVGIGMSAGGLEACTRLLAGLPSDTGLAFLLIPHLSPTHPSQLAEILSRRAPVPVTEVGDGDRMHRDHLYVLPPDRSVRIADGYLRLAPREARDGGPTVIDECFASLAEAWGREAVGVILSGTGSDGTQGLQAIKARGGTTYAQDFASAAYDGMPRSAVEAGGVDFTLPPEQIARSLVAGAGGPAEAPEDDRPPADEGGPTPTLSPDDAQALEAILGVLQDATAADFQHYKRPTMARRIARRAGELGQRDLGGYLALLREQPSEVENLLAGVLIQVTEFFRDPGMYDGLRSTVLPALLARRAEASPLRVWVAGCATGEEAYSTAIVLAEVESDLKRQFPHKIFASDLSQPAITTARRGFYPTGIASQVSAERLERFFVPVDGGYQVGKRLRDACVFARQDLTRDPPFGQLDLVICRNLLIYLEPELQRRVLHVFHYALKPGGFLALGPAESVAGQDRLFSPIDRKNKLYLRRTVASGVPGIGWSGQARPGSLVRRPSGPARAPWSHAELQRAAAQALFATYPRASVIVNPDMEIRHFQGAISPYLEPPSGGPTVSLLRMAHPDLRLILGRLLRKAGQQRGMVSRRDVPLQVGRRVERVTVTVLPVPTDETEREHYLVVFEPGAPAGRPGEALRKSAGTADGHALELEQELADTKEYLQAIIDQQDVTHAELQAAYEASLSTNEEFQSTNEELESTKEELQSVNEELITVNEEMHQRNAELSARTAEVSGLLEAMEFPILLLTADLRLQAFNSAAAAQLRLPPSARGREVTQVELPVPTDQLRGLVGLALKEGTLQERQTQDRDGRWVALRIWPVRPASGPTPAVVAALVDITQLRDDLERADQARDFSEAILEAVGEPMLVLDGGLRIVTANRAFALTTAVDPAAVPGAGLADVGTGEWDIPALHALLAGVHRSGIPLEDHEVGIRTDRLGERTFRLNARRIIQPGDTRTLILLVLADVTSRREMEQQLLEASRMQAVGQLAGGVAHEINNQMTSVLGFTSFLVRSTGMTVEQRSDLAHIHRAASRAAEVTRQLLTFSRRQPLATAAFDLNALVAISDNMLQRLLGPDLTLRFALGEAAGTVRVDQALFEQMLVNLVLNARDAMSPGGELTLATTSVLVTDSAPEPGHGARAPQGRYARLIVSDTGTGMDETTRRRAFEPFFTTKPVGLGTGLGLASVYGLVKQSGGFVWVESAEGVGTTFTIDLPQIASEATAMAPAAPVAVPRGSETILVVEDEPAVREWLARSLRELGYTVLEAAEGGEALDRLEREGDAVTLVITDVMMPGMGGVELRDRLAETHPGLAVLLSSAHAFDSLVARGILDPGAFVLPKPFEVPALATRIRELLDQPA
ncbi:MAG: chemotaxis protein CheB [Gemmatimonadales bacterium]